MEKVSNINRKHLPLPNVLNGCNGEKYIANMWGDHYETLLNCVKLDECKGEIIDFLSPDNTIKNVVIQPSQVEEALKAAKLGQACGHMPLSRRLDRCDRVIQDEVGDSNGGNV